MWPVIGAAIVGALFAKSRAPKTRVKKLVVLGTRSGMTWEVEDFPELAVVHVRGNNVKAVFRRVGTNGFAFDHGEGDRKILRWLLLDFGQDLGTPSAQKSPP